MRPPLWWRWLLWPLELLYRAFLSLRWAAYRAGWRRARRLRATVISVGNLSVGGTGKTPLVSRLVAWLGERGEAVAVLTRGYARAERTPLVVAGRASGELPTVEKMGDEPVLLARRHPKLILGIGSDRYALGRRILAQSPARPPEVFLLDDGFQHLRLVRDLDIVLLDATDPFTDNAVLPAGRLREPPAALARADLIVLTRTQGVVPRELETSVRRYNNRAPLFTASMKLTGLFEAASHRPADLSEAQSQPALAFCGIGNPAAFWDDLGCWGFDVVSTMVFPDHHRYTVPDFKRIVRQADAAGAKVLLTTEKDAVNLSVVPPSVPPYLYCRAEMVFDDEEGFFAAVSERLREVTSQHA